MEINKSFPYEEINIDISNLFQLDNFSSEFICIICLGMVIKPLQLKCCDHLICTACLKMYIKNNYQILKCPLCKRSLTYETPNKIIMRLYSNLEIKCKNKGCSNILKFDQYFSHVFNDCMNLDEVLKNKYKYCKQCEELYEINIIEGIVSSGSNNTSRTHLHECRVYKMKNEYKDCKLHKHKLKYTNLRKHFQYELYGWLCDFCEDAKDPSACSHHCNQCKIDICDLCIELVKGKKAKTSLHEHELILTDMIEWQCDVCCKMKNQCKAWSCFACNFDCCIKCYWE